MSFTKRTYTDGETVITAENLPPEDFRRKPMLGKRNGCPLGRAGAVRR